MIYFTGDTHFGDARVPRIDRRPFSDMSDHDAALISNWNSRVLPEDEIWHLGDFSVKRAGYAEQLLSQLHGEKHLIGGNNDPAGTTRATGWASVHHYAELTIDGHRLILCHYPFPTLEPDGQGGRSICTVTPMEG